jgi:hypothetical protein
MRYFRTYFLDDPLSQPELEVVKSAVARKERLSEDQVEINEVRVSQVWAAGSASRTSNDIKREVRLLRRNLQNAGIGADAGKQVIWIMPKPENTYWGAAIQMAIIEETGFSPFTVQRWDGTGQRRPAEEILIIDMEAQMGGSWD